jgi:hypothetical protein
VVKSVLQNDSTCSVMIIVYFFDKESFITFFISCVMETYLNLTDEGHLTALSVFWHVSEIFLPCG